VHYWQWLSPADELAWYQLELQGSMGTNIAKFVEHHSLSNWSQTCENVSGTCMIHPTLYFSMVDKSTQSHGILNLMSEPITKWYNAIADMNILPDHGCQIHHKVDVVTCSQRSGPFQ